MKIYYLLLLITILISCKENLIENELNSKFKSKDIKIITKNTIEDNISYSKFIINSDSTFISISKLNSKEVDFYTGTLIENNDTTKFIPKEIKNFNFFLAYETSNSRKDKNNYSLEVFDKTGNKINQIEIILFNKMNPILKTTKNGKLLIDREIDSISFPILKTLTKRNHSIKLQNNHSDFKIYLDTNFEIFENKTINYNLNKNSTFTIFSPLKNLIN